MDWIPDYLSGILGARFEQERAVEVLSSVEGILLLCLALVTDLRQSLVTIADRPPRLVATHIQTIDLKIRS